MDNLVVSDTVLEAICFRVNSSLNSTGARERSISRSVLSGLGATFSKREGCHATRGCGVVRTRGGCILRGSLFRHKARRM